MNEFGFKEIGFTPESPRKEMINAAYNEAYSSFESFYGGGEKLKIHIISPDSFKRQFGDDGHNDIPRGQYQLRPAISIDAETYKIVQIPGVMARNIYYIDGDLNLIDSEDRQGLIEEILGHELIHSQTQFIPLVGCQNPQLTSRDLRVSQDIHYVSGFKAVRIDGKNQNKINVSGFLEEYVTQYLTMAMFDELENKNSSLASIFEAKKGIDPEYIEAAEILNEVFTNVGITPYEVEKLHRNSNLKGFLELLRFHNNKVAGIIISAGTNPDQQLSIKKLREVLGVTS